jgi:hypothetical protein
MLILIIWIILSLIFLPVYLNTIKESQTENKNPVVKAAEDIIKGL